jgi:hypothetical protein
VALLLLLLLQLPPLPPVLLLLPRVLAGLSPVAEAEAGKPQHHHQPSLLLLLGPSLQRILREG